MLSRVRLTTPADVQTCAAPLRSARANAFSRVILDFGPTALRGLTGCAYDANHCHPHWPSHRRTGAEMEFAAAGAGVGQIRGGSGSRMKVLFFSQDGTHRKCCSSPRTAPTKVEQIVLALRLRWPDLTSLVASQGGLGLQVIEQDEPDFVIMCEDLSNLGIWDAIREIRRFSDIPIIVATENEGDSEMHAVKALELGADDYIEMPCNLMVVMARVVALLRRVGLAKQRNEETTIVCGDLVIDPANYEVFLGPERLVLTPTEFKLLHLLARNRHMTLSQPFIHGVIWGDDVQVGETLKKYVQRLRRKLGDDAKNPTWIKTVHGVGYRFSAPAAPPAELTPTAVAD